MHSNLNLLTTKQRWGFILLHSSSRHSNVFRAKHTCWSKQPHGTNPVISVHLPKDDELLTMSPLQLANVAYNAIRQKVVPRTSWMEAFVMATHQNRMFGLPITCYLVILELAVMTRQVIYQCRGDIVPPRYI